MFTRRYGTQNPSPLDSETTRGTASLKHRLFGSDNSDDTVRMRPSKRQPSFHGQGFSSQRLMDEDENDSRPRSPLRRTVSIAPLFANYQPHASYEASNYPDLAMKHRRHQSPPSPSEHSLATKVKNGYVNLRNAHYTKLMEHLEKAQTELTTEINDSLKFGHQKLESLANQSAQLHGPLSDEEAEYSAKGADGRYRTDSVPIKEAIASFEGRLESTITSLEELWASWDEAQAKIESLSNDLTSDPESGDPNGQSSDWKKLMDAIEGSDDGTARLEAELEKLNDETAEAYKQQEKIFLARIKDAGHGVFMGEMFR